MITSKDLELMTDEYIISQYIYYDSLHPQYHVVREAGMIYQLRDQYFYELKKRGLHE